MKPAESTTTEPPCQAPAPTPSQPFQTVCNFLSNSKRSFQKSKNSDSLSFSFLGPESGAHMFCRFDILKRFLRLRILYPICPKNAAPETLLFWQMEANNDLASGSFRVDTQTRSLSFVNGTFFENETLEEITVKRLFVFSMRIADRMFDPLMKELYRESGAERFLRLSCPPPLNPFPS